MTAAPIVKWAGGKTKLLPELLKRMPDNFGRYYEPFLGGGALYFRLGVAPAFLGDTNSALISMYSTVRDSVRFVVNRLRRHRACHSAEHYNNVRGWFNSHSVGATTVDRAAAFIYLNKTCFNGLWRVNAAGDFNVPMGRYKNPPILDEVGLCAASNALQGARLMNTGYHETIASATRGDFIYFDPPYDPVSASSNFASYAASGFDRSDQEQLEERVRQRVLKGCKVMLSNSDTPFVRKLYRNRCFTIHTVTCDRSINSKGDKRGAVNELIITGGY